jgi:hypothetical protein
MGKFSPNSRIEYKDNETITKKGHHKVSTSSSSFEEEIPWNPNEQRIILLQALS